MVEHRLTQIAIIEAPVKGERILHDRTSRSSGCLESVRLLEVAVAGQELREGAWRRFGFFDGPWSDKATPWALRGNTFATRRT